tara:strand:+ start:1939 stop:2142 length:204 start_codon:yes stop_codon:yes gene_type:complete
MAKGVSHYTEDGRIYNGETHKMPDGSLHTGKTHTASSVKLFHLNELPKQVKKKIMSEMNEKTLMDSM